MADRKLFFKRAKKNSELAKLLKKTEGKVMSNEEYKEQMISFVYGNAMNIKGITKESVRRGVEDPMGRYMEVVKSRSRS